MLSHNKVSIITVCYNSKSTILDTIQSVQSQTYPYREHIIIDGQSTDGTLELLERHRDKFDVLISERDSGVYEAMNKGIKLAKGDIIGFLNSDDIFFDKNSLGKIVSGFERPDIEAVYGDLIYVAKNDMEKVLRLWRATSFKSGLFSKGWCPPHPTFYVKKSVYQRCGDFDLSLPIANDVELMMRFLEPFKIRAQYINEILVRMRVGGISNNSIKNILHQNCIILKSLKKHCLKFSYFYFIVSKLKSRILQLCHRQY